MSKVALASIVTLKRTRLRLFWLNCDRCDTWSAFWRSLWRRAPSSEPCGKRHTGHVTVDRCRPVNWHFWSEERPKLEAYHATWSWPREWSDPSANNFENKNTLRLWLFEMHSDAIGFGGEVLCSINDIHLADIIERIKKGPAPGEQPFRPDIQVKISFSIPPQITCKDNVAVCRLSSLGFFLGGPCSSLRINSFGKSRWATKGPSRNPPFPPAARWWLLLRVIADREWRAPLVSRADF